MDSNAHGGPPPVLCIGEALIGFTPEVGWLAAAEDVQLFVAGAELNVAVGLAHLGDAVEWFGRVGDDPFGARIRAHLSHRGVAAEHVRTDPTRPTGIYFKDRGGVHYYRSTSAATAMSPADLPALHLDSRRWIHLSGITPALSPTCADLIDATLRGRVMNKIYDAPAAVSFDVNYRAALWPDRAQAAARLAELARLATVVITGRDEAEQLWGVSAAEDIAVLFPRAETVVVKDAEVGAWEFRDGQGTFVQSPRVRVVEPVGAGDAFAAGYIHGRLSGADAVRRLRLGHVLAAHTLTALVDSPALPDAAELAAFCDLPDARWAELTIPTGEER